jgi:hypothetical protein
LDQSTLLRERAAVERAAAAASNLPMRREMHIRAAEVWETMAAQIEVTAERSVVNATAKLAGATR